MDAKQRQLVMDNLWLADQMVRYLPYYSLPEDERLSIALLGLVEAALNFDESKGFKFTSFARTVIRNMMIKELDRTCKHQSAYPLDKPFENLNGEELTLLDMIPDVENGYEEIELSDLTGRIQDLPKEQRKAVDLIVCQGMKPKKVSRIMRRRESWLDTCVKQGLDTLKAHYLGGGYKICK